MGLCPHPQCPLGPQQLRLVPLPQGTACAVLPSLGPAELWGQPTSRIGERLRNRAAPPIALRSPQRRFPVTAMPRVPGPLGLSRARLHRVPECSQVRQRPSCGSDVLPSARPRPPLAPPLPTGPPPNTPTSPRLPVFYDFNWRSVQRLYDPHVCSNGTFIRRLRAYGSPGLRKRFNSHEPTQARPFTPAAAGHKTCSVIKATSTPSSSRLRRAGASPDGELRASPAPPALMRVTGS